ncbi:hypothetical protein NUW58_g10435 [Xylaria curta]|uniref:Uncharacterized protein n=1 Tax=Xylaria curta TaxID=42375 RepID=A0ACC1MLE5_9PEZI|nr:hypothetical protein NUW58_g10435 [Xylaria curta]
MLLLCKQITREALTLLRLCPFVIDRIPPWIMGNSRPLPLTCLISKNTLQNLRFVEIKLSLGDGDGFFSGRVWFRVLEDVLRAWSGENSLIRLKIMIKVSNIDTDRIWVFELKNYAAIVNMIDDFAFKHGSKPDLVQYEHWVLDCDYAYKCGFRNVLEEDKAAGKLTHEVDFLEPMGGMRHGRLSNGVSSSISLVLHTAYRRASRNTARRMTRSAYTKEKQAKTANRSNHQQANSAHVEEGTGTTSHPVERGHQLRP